MQFSRNAVTHCAYRSSRGLRPDLALRVLVSPGDMARKASTPTTPSTAVPTMITQLSIGNPAHTIGMQTCELFCMTSTISGHILRGRCCSQAIHICARMRTATAVISKNNLHASAAQHSLLSRSRVVPAAGNLMHASHSPLQSRRQDRLSANFDVCYIPPPTLFLPNRYDRLTTVPYKVRSGQVLPRSLSVPAWGPER